MGKTHEALLRAEKEYRDNFLPIETEPLSKKDLSSLKQASKKPNAEIYQLPSPRKTISQDNGLAYYEDLKTNLLTRYSDKSLKMILFNGIRHGGGCSTTAINFAITLTKNSDLKVLLIDVNLRTPGLRDVFKIDAALGLSDLPDDNNDVTSLINKVGPGNLNVLTTGEDYSVPLSLFESSRFDRFLATIGDDFDYVILDAPPVPKFPECRVLCPKVDGVILVVEAGITRRHVALMAKKKIEQAGGTLLGIVINRRKHYIPDWIYRRL